MSGKSEMIMLIEKYQENHLDDLLKQIFQNVIFEKLCYDDYEKLYEIQNALLKKMIILKAPQELLIKLLLKEENKELISNILYVLDQKRIEPQIADMLLNEDYYKIKEFASRYASIDKLIEKLMEEEIGEGIKRLEGIKLSRQQANKLLNSTSYKVRKYAIKYASTEQLVNRLIKEDDFIITIKILGRLKEVRISEKQANRLIKSGEWNVRFYALEYASVNKLIEILDKEHNESVICRIKSILKECVLTEKQANKLVESKHLDMRLFAIKYASTEELLKILVKEDNLDVIDEITNYICWFELDAENIDKLLVATSWKVRIIAVKYASVSMLIKRLPKEENIEVITEYLKRFEELKISEEQADELLDISEYLGYAIEICAIKYASINKLIERTMEEKNNKIIDAIINRFKESKISEEQADKLLKAYNYDIRKYAVKYVSISRLLEILKEEENYYVREEILKRLEEYKLSEEQANEFMKSQYWNVRKYASKYSSISKLLEALKEEEVDMVAEQIINRLEESKIREEEANQILNAKHWKARFFASKYATLEKVIEVLKEEKCIPVINEILKRFEKLKTTDIKN